MFIDGLPQKQWIFEETKLDNEHFVSVALNKGSTQVNLPNNIEKLHISIGSRHLKSDQSLTKLLNA